MKRLTEELALSDDRPDITPLIDVIFMLLLFFLVTTAFAEETFFPLQLPTARHAQVRTPADAATVEISRDGELAVDGEFMASPTRLYEHLRAAQRGGEFQSVIIKADEQADARHVVTVLDMLRELEVNEFAVAVSSPSS